jgi:hypothetical protein
MAHGEQGSPHPHAMMETSSPRRGHRESNPTIYFVSLCSVCLRQRLQYFDSFSFSAFARLFLVLE